MLMMLSPPLPMIARTVLGHTSFSHQTRPSWLRVEVSFGQEALRDLTLVQRHQEGLATCLAGLYTPRAWAFWSGTPAWRATAKPTICRRRS